MLDLESLARLHHTYSDASSAHVREFAIADVPFAFNRQPAIMGVVNLSADSWYRESVCLSVDQAIRRGRVLAAQGAAIVDVGAESSLAHAARLDPVQQLKKLLPVVRGLRESGVLVSAESYSPEVAEAVLDAGANILNLTGTEATERIYRAAAERSAAVIICFVQGKNVRDVGDLKLGTDSVGAMHEYFARAIDSAQGQGLERILIDPGLGFYYRNLQDSAARIRYQMEVFLNSFRLRTLGWPICHALPHAFEYFGEEVRCAEPFFAVLASLGKTDLFRTHEVPRVKAVLDTLGVYPGVMAGGSLT